MYASANLKAPMHAHLGDEEEVISLRQGDDVVHHGARERIARLAAVRAEETRVDALRHHDVGELGADLVLHKHGLYLLDLNLEEKEQQQFSKVLKSYQNYPGRTNFVESISNNKQYRPNSFFLQ